MNKLTTRFYIILTAGFVLSLVSLHFFWINKIENLFYKIEAQQISKSSNQIQYLARMESKQILLKTNDWSSWDHTYEFIKGRRPQYIQENFKDPLSALKLIQIHFMIYADLNQNVKLSYFVNEDYSKQIQISAEDIQKILFIFKDTLEPKTDYLKIQNKNYLLTLNKITMSDGSQHEGYLIAGKVINDDFLHRLESITNLKIRFYEDLLEQDPLVGDTDIKFFPLITNSFNQPFLKLEAVQERTTYLVWKQVKMQTMILFSVFFAICFVIIVSLLKTVILKPIETLADELKSLSSSDEWKDKKIGRLKITEFDRIAESVNKLLIHIQQSEEKVKSSELNMLQAEKFKSLGEMASSVGHEINNPLSVILGNLTLLKRDLETKGFVSEAKENYIKQIDKSLKMVERINKIIKSLRAISRNESADEVSIVSVNQCISDSLELAKDRFFQSGISLEFKSDLQATVYGRSGELVQVIVNLLNNSFDGVSNQEKPWVKISLDQQDQFVLIHITDSGSGIDKSVQEKMMNPFYTTKAIGKGTGLGLSISKSLIEKMDGQLYYEEKQGHTNFVIKLKSGDAANWTKVS